VRRRSCSPRSCLRSRLTRSSCLPPTLGKISVGKGPSAKVGHDRTTLLALPSGCRWIVVHRDMKEVYGGIDAAILDLLDLFPPVQISWKPAIDSVVAHYRAYCVHCVVIKTSTVEAIAGGQSKQGSARVAVARTLHNHASRPQRDWKGIGRMARLRVVLTYGKVSTRRMCRHWDDQVLPNHSSHSVCPPKAVILTFIDV